MGEYNNFVYRANPSHSCNILIYFSASMKVTNLVLFLTIFAICFQQTHQYLGVDVSQLFSVENYTCMKNAGITFSIARGYCSYGGVDQHAVQSLTNMKAAGIPNVDMYMFPCRGK